MCDARQMHSGDSGTRQEVPNVGTSSMESHLSSRDPNCSEERGAGVAVLVTSAGAPTGPCWLLGCFGWPQTETPLNMHETCCAVQKSFVLWWVPWLFGFASSQGLTTSRGTDAARSSRSNEPDESRSFGPATSFTSSLGRTTSRGTHAARSSRRTEPDASRCFGPATSITSSHRLTTSRGTFAAKFILLKTRGA